MILLRTIINSIPGKQKEVLQTLHSLIEPSEKEKGCLRYQIFRDIDDIHAFYMISEWQTRQHLDLHMRSDRFGILLGTQSLLCEPLNIKIVTVTETEGIEAAHSVRKKTNACFPSRGKKTAV